MEVGLLLLHLLHQTCTPRPDLHSAAVAPSSSCLRALLHTHLQPCPHRPAITAPTPSHPAILTPPLPRSHCDRCRVMSLRLQYRMCPTRPTLRRCRFSVCRTPPNTPLPIVLVAGLARAWMAFPLGVELTMQ
eukprot:Rmarinus@m.16328